MKTRRLNKKQPSLTRLKVSLLMSGLALSIAGYQSIMSPHWETIYIKPQIVVEAKSEPLITADPIEDEKVRFIRRVRMLESSNGNNGNPEALHNICKARGKVNNVGYGGMQGISGELFCFDSSEQEAAKLSEWYREHRAKMSEAQTYCTYNIGEAVSDCPYWEHAQQY